MAVSAQRDLVNSMKTETFRNVSIISKVHPLPSNLKHLFNKNALEKLTQNVFNRLSYYLVSIVDPGKAASFSWPLYDTKSEKNYRKELSSFIADYCSKGLLSPVMSSYLVKPACYKVTLFMFQLSQLAVQRLLMSKMKTEQQKKLYTEVTEKYKAQDEDFVQAVEKQEEMVLLKLSNYLQKRKSYERMAELFRNGINSMEDKLTRLKPKELVASLVDSFVMNNSVDEETKASILEIKNFDEPAQYLSKCLEDIDLELDSLETEWNTKMSPILNSASKTMELSKELIERQTGEADKTSFILEYNHNTDEISTNVLQGKVNSQQKYILKNIDKNDRLSFPNLVRGYVVAVSYILKNKQIGDEIIRLNKYLEQSNVSYSEMVDGMRAVMERLRYAEARLEVFSEAIISFSIGGHHFQDEPIRYTNVEDNIFESSRNISIKLHHRIGKWVRIELRFSSRWILISEVVFDSDVAQGNYTPESQKTSLGEEKTKLRPSNPQIPISTAHQEDPLYMAIVVGVLTALVILLAVAVFLIIHRHRHRKCFASPLAKTTVSQKREDSYSRCGTSSHVSMLPANKMNIDCALDVKSDEYQEPYQALKCAPYFSYSTVLLEMKDFVKDSNTALSDSSNYDYAVPELSSAPLLTKRRLGDSLSDRATEIMGERLDIDVDARLSAAGSVRSKHSARSASQQEVFIDMKRRLETTNVIEFPRHRLRMISKLAEGAFGTVYVAEADGVPEYNGTITPEKRLVAVKFLCHDASAKEREEFERDVRILAALSSPHLARVLGACRSPPLAVVLEYLELGDLCALLRAAPPPPSALLHIATQIAAGMQYLESLNFVHRDLAARNILVGKGYQVKISDFGTDNEAYACDYYKVDGRIPLPLRWAAWESVLLGKYTTKSDVWAFAVTLHEIFTLCRRRPYEHLTEDEVLENLSHLQLGDGLFESLARPAGCPRDLHDLMRACWRRDELARPAFADLHLLLQRTAA